MSRITEVASQIASELIVKLEALIAEHHDAPMRTSAEVCLADARELQRRGGNVYAANRAMRGATYLIGIAEVERWMA